MTIPSDNPIESPNEDLLDRKGVAENFAQHILKLDVSKGAVVGVFGPWGSGKTSFLNFARKEFEQNDIPVLDFNPWLFSGTEQLVGRFFDEISAELKIRDFAKIGKVFEDYGRVFTGVTGGFLKIVGAWIRRKGGVNSRREEIEAVLRERKKPIVVILDDVDRLSPSEIRDIFKLVRLTVSFPNIVYIVACDRLLVEQVLGEEGLPGRDYLEKIIQLPFDLPQAPDHRLYYEFGGISSSIQKYGPFDKQVWAYVSREIVQPLIRNMRDFRRYNAAVQGTAVALEDKVELADVLGLEAVRIFLPDVFRGLPSLMDILTVRSPLSPDDSEPSSYDEGFWNAVERKETMDVDARSIAELIKADKAPGVVKAMLRLLFPACGKNIFGEYIQHKHKDKDVEKIRKLLSVTDTMKAKQYLLDRRVAHEAILRLYLERVPAEDWYSSA